MSNGNGETGPDNDRIDKRRGGLYNTQTMSLMKAFGNKLGPKIINCYIRVFLDPKNPFANNSLLIGGKGIKDQVFYGARHHIQLAYLTSTIS